MLLHSFRRDMSSHDFGFAADFFISFFPFTTGELEDFVLVIPQTNRLRKLVWEWITTNGPYPTISPSPPALGDPLSAPASYPHQCKPIPAASLAFYSLLNGKVYPRLFHP
ncbi:hypothetical protein O181_057008 [Austropuccinia psidii MF-1]|uniref:Uncharacterized protein n=1 Tax=Austropuccinia psidii MF-1 TaxID=1389203 RepID=A0A9Q3EAJ6_9BASI|nr:hypothetical protein [Austropuccinia psidii MF-1]